MLRYIIAMTTKVISSPASSPLRLAQEAVSGGCMQQPQLSAMRNLNAAFATTTQENIKSTNMDSSSQSSDENKKFTPVIDEINKKIPLGISKLNIAGFNVSDKSSHKSNNDGKQKSSIMDPSVSEKENFNPELEKEIMMAMFSDVLSPKSLDRHAIQTKSDKTQPIHLKDAVSLDDDNSQELGNKNDCGSKSDSVPSELMKKRQNVARNPGSRPFTVSIEGNIGSGKSTFLNHFSSRSGVKTFQEPLWKWTDVGGHNLLGKFYEDPKRWSFLFQSYVQLTRLNIHLQNDADAKVKLIERSLQNNRYCFMECEHDSDILQHSEFDVLCEYFNFLEDNLDLGVDLIVYLRSSPSIVHERMKKRGRTEEAGVPLAYLQKVHDYYERWLMDGQPCAPPAPVLVIDANSDLDTVLRYYDHHTPVILGRQPHCAGQTDGGKAAAAAGCSAVEASDSVAASDGARASDSSDDARASDEGDDGAEASDDAKTIEDAGANDSAKASDEGSDDAGANQ